MNTLLEVIDGSLALSGSHATIQHDRSDARTTETPFDKLQHGGELREDDGFAAHVL